MKRLIVILLLSGQIAFAQENPVFPKGREVFQNIDRSCTKLVLIGDSNHDLDTIPVAVAKALIEIKSVDASYNCLFVEEDQRLQPALDEFWSRPEISILAYRQPMANLIQSKARDLLFLLLQRQTNDQLMVQAKELGMRIFAIDVDRSSSEGKEALSAAGISENSMRGNNLDIPDAKAFARKTIEARNHIMANGIERRFSDGSCTKGIAFVGNAHVAINEIAGEKIDSLYKDLVKENIKSIVASTSQVDCSKNDMDHDSCVKLSLALKQDVLFSEIPAQDRDGDVTDFYILSN